MKFIKDHIYACSFPINNIRCIFYGIYIDSDKTYHNFKYLFCENYGTWIQEDFSFSIKTAENEYEYIGPVKDHPEYLI